MPAADVKSVPERYQQLFMLGSVAIARQPVCGIDAVSIQQRSRPQKEVAAQTGPHVLRLCWWGYRVLQLYPVLHAICLA